MNAPAQGIALTTVSVPSLAMTDDELMEVMENSVYPGADRKSIKLVIAYCRGVNKDPLKKVVHIVPMDLKVKKPNGNGYDYVKRDVIMEGIASYRMDAARTGQHVGTSEPIFGPIVKLSFTEQREENGPRETVEFEHPEWCKITVTKLIEGKEYNFTAIEYWIENYATAGRTTKAPNAMWRKRSRGQLAKCTEAQALRKAFPDTVSAAPTVEEMEGKTIDHDEINADGTVRPKVEGPRAKSESAAQPGSQSATDTTGGGGNAADPEAVAAGSAAKPADNGKPAVKKPISQGSANILKKKMAQSSKTDADLNAKFGFRTCEEVTTDRYNEIIEWAEQLAAH